MIRTSEARFGLLMNAVRTVTKETCTSVWGDAGYSLDDCGDAIHSFCKFYMSFCSNGDIDESCADAYARQIKDTAEMVSSLNKQEIFIDTTIEERKVKNADKIMKMLVALAEIGFPDDYLEKFLAPSDEVLDK